MEKQSVNLLIKKEEGSPFVSRLRIFLPIAALVALFLFVFSFLGSIIYINKNNDEFTRLQKETAAFEKKISDKKYIEGIYTLTVARIATIDQLATGTKNFANLLSEILKLSSSGITFTQASLDKNNAVTVAVVASSAASLDNFVATLLKTEVEKSFSEIKSSGIVRDKNGAYLLTISLKPNVAILQ